MNMMMGGGGHGHGHHGHHDSGGGGNNMMMPPQGQQMPMGMSPQQQQPMGMGMPQQQQPMGMGMPQQQMMPNQQQPMGMGMGMGMPQPPQPGYPTMPPQQQNIYNPLQQLALNATQAPQWGFIVNESGLVLDIAGEKRNPGAKICAWNRKNPAADNQLWMIQGREVISKLNGFLITCNGNRLQMMPRNASPGQQFWLDGNTLRCDMNGQVVDIEGGAQAGRDVITWNQNGQINQRWRFEPSAGMAPVPTTYAPQQQQAYGYIQNDSGLVMDLAGNNRNPGAKICAWNKNNPASDNQLWSIQGREIVSKLNGLCVTCGQGNHLQMQPRNGSPAQQFWFEGQLLKCAMNGQAVDIEGGAAAGKDLITWQPHGQVNQRWRFAPIPMNIQGYVPPAPGVAPQYPQGIPFGMPQVPVGNQFQVMNPEWGQQRESRLRQLYQQFTATDGVLSLDELQQILYAFGMQLDQQQTMQFLYNTDANKDGNISFDELRCGMMQLVRCCPCNKGFY